MTTLPFKLETGEHIVWGFPRLGNPSNRRAGVVGPRPLLLTIGIPTMIVTWTIHIVPGVGPGLVVVVGQPWGVPGWFVWVAISGKTPGQWVIATLIRGINKTNLVRGDEEIPDEDRVFGCVDSVAISLGSEHPADLTKIVATSADVPEIGEVVEAMRD